jgi:pSer/pThr/pTyr-binding forkhead associated (FHA) protein
LVVGRTPDSPLGGLCSNNISFHHAEIYVDGRPVVVVDTNSTNGTFIDEERLLSSVPRVLTRTAEVRLASDPPLRLTIEVQEER